VVSGPGVKRAKPWQAPRPASAIARLDAGDELLTLVAFDVPCDKARRRVGEICKDYGLARTQWSVFEGPMTRNRREELGARIEALFAAAEGGGRFGIYPIGAREAEWVIRAAGRGVKPKPKAEPKLAAGAEAWPESAEDPDDR
jgi:CRISPR-associated protein Cas2